MTEKKASDIISLHTRTHTHTHTHFYLYLYLYLSLSLSLSTPLPPPPVSRIHTRAFVIIILISTTVREAVTQAPSAPTMKRCVFGIHGPQLVPTKIEAMRFRGSASAETAHATYV